MPSFELKPFQKKAIRALQRSPAHVLCVSPTGSGKSLIFEREIATGKHKALLVTPLVALARQQFERVQRSAHRSDVTRLGSGSPSQGPPSGPGTWIVSPELLSFSKRRTALEKWVPDFLIVDECHCLWDWGEQFRPAFTEIPSLIRKYGIPRSLWLTATLPASARAELKGQLPSSLIEIGTFDLPPSLHIELCNVPWTARIEALLSWVRAQTGCGLIFTATREGTERVARALASAGSSALAYHAGLSHEERRNIEKLISTGSGPSILVATSAFGMGMNHDHFRWVALLQPPGSILGLIQSVGRAARKPEIPARAGIFWHPDDFQLLEWMTQGSERKRTELLQLRQFLMSSGCRRGALRRYFEEDASTLASCGLCDECDRQPRLDA